MFKLGTATTILGLTLAVQAHAVEMLGEKDMGSIHMVSGVILNVFGAPAAGQVSRVGDGGGAPPPIEQTAGTVAGIELALQTPDILRNPSERNYTPIQDPRERVFPELPLNVPATRNVSSPFSPGGGVSFRILPGDQVIASSLEMRPGDTTDSLRVTNTTRIDEIRIQNVDFPGIDGILENGRLVMRGFSITTDVLISEQP